jgi:ABC-type lipoprotein release transport system permease subunit
MLCGVTALDPATYSSVVCLILLVAELASLVPAVRAARIEPVRVSPGGMTVLEQEK